MRLTTGFSIPIRRPRIIWVVGDGTEAGKSTVAMALIRLLNRNGVRTIPMKPYSASQLTLLPDRLAIRDPAKTAPEVGGDAMRLSRTSPLTDGYFDLVAPISFVCHPTFRTTVAARSGSLLLGNMVYYRPEPAWPQPEPEIVADAIGKLGVPLASARPWPGLNFRDAPRLDQAAVLAAYRWLLRLEPHTMVIEGAGAFLPAFDGMPTIDHVVHVQRPAVTVYAGLGARLRFEPGRQLIPAAPFVDRLEARGYRPTPFCLPPVAEAELAGMADGVARDILAVFDRAEGLRGRLERLRPLRRRHRGQTTAAGATAAAPTAGPSGAADGLPP
ncbi:hypothetical protein [Prosthecodimorpha staleyi]|uniref:Dethiobiotin synthase n=1 Tax=Prosthecodimorpha staleyi TaxID=2840188 RepID=A0A947CZR6_9HYPH|nr:hypothetical protein [Prosthecodimorpha staleyi]MBT9288283.1 hypothetical protein [Prosthecodimorpha staleyi]